MHRLQELVRLHRMGTKAKDVARLLRMSPNTERTYREAIGMEGWLDGSPEDLPEDLPELEVLKAAVLKHKPAPTETPAQEISSIEKWTPQVEALFAKGLGAKAIFDRLRQEHSDFGGSYWAVKRMVKQLRKARGVRAQDVAIPVETMPGEIAQVDFGYVGRLFDPEQGVLRRAWAFVIVLAYSRHMFAEVVFDQRTETWLALHGRAFQFFGGVPETMVPDNLKAAVIRAAFGIGDDPSLNRSYVELARHYGFKIDPTPPFDAPKKGKVEAGVKYVKRNALAGREGEDITTVNRALGRWVVEIAGYRTHGTIGKQPLVVFEQEEQVTLHSLPAKPFEPVIWKSGAKVHPDSHVVFDKRLYSVPWRLIGKKVWIRATRSTVTIFADETRIATHLRRGKGLRSTIEEHLPEGRRDLRHRSRAYWEERATAISPEVLAYVRELFDAGDVLSQLRTVQAIVTHLEGFPVTRAEAACRRARFFGIYSYRGVKQILAKALDLEPLPGVVLPPVSGETPRFARSVHELLGLEVRDEPN